MKITVERFTSDKEATISKILVDGKFLCFGLEDQHQLGEKINGETRIPPGHYDIGVRAVGGFHTRYTKRFDFHQGMLHVLDVPGFEYILIHVGNDDGDTAGCLLTGMTATGRPGNYSIGSSTEAYKLLYSKVIECALDGDLEIEYIDQDILPTPKKKMLTYPPSGDDS